MTLIELLEDWLRDIAATGLALLSSVGVVGVAFTAEEPVWTAIGVLAGMAATVAPFVPLARHASLVSTWVTMVSVATFDAAVILVLLAR